MPVVDLATPFPLRRPLRHVETGLPNKTGHDKGKKAPDGHVGQMAFYERKDFGVFWISMKRWYLYLTVVSLGVVIMAYSLVVRLNAPINFAEVLNMVNQPKKIQTDPAKEVGGKAVSPDVLELRQRHHLRPLTTLENGTHLKNLPRGIYGFSVCGVASLNAKREDTSLLEIHKHLDGIVYYVGYASKDDVEKYLARKNNFHILASPYPGDKASLLFEIPIDFVSKCETRQSKEGNIFDLFVVAIPELFS